MSVLLEHGQGFSRGAPFSTQVNPSQKTASEIQSDLFMFLSIDRGAGAPEAVDAVSRCKTSTIEVKIELVFGVVCGSS